MKKKYIILASVFSVDFFDQISASGKNSNVREYIFSDAGAIDIVAACCLGVGLVAAHELGHALVAKFLWGCSTEIVISSPISGYTIVPGDIVTSALPEERLALCLAGPASGALASYSACRELYAYEGLYITKWITLVHLLANTVGPFSTAHLFKGTDGSRALEELKKIIKNKYDRK